MATLTDVLTKRGARKGLAPSEDAAPSVRATDNELLNRFTRENNAEAFNELVARHADMVMRVCQRVLRDEHEAEDVFQATFLVLALKGRKIRGRHTASLGAWLHRVAYRMAIRAARSQHRKGAPLMEDVASTDLEQWCNIARQEEQLLLHEELSKLPAHFREALVLCSLEGHSCKDAAEQIGASPEAIQKRVERGKQLLRMRLARRGVGVSAGMIAIGTATSHAASLDSLVSLTSEICAATVLHADKSIFATNVGCMAQQGVSTMKLLSPIVIAASALVLASPVILLAGLSRSNSSANASLEVQSHQAPTENQAVLVAKSVSPAALSQDENQNQELDEKLRIIIDRQTDDTIKLYLNETRAYVNGKSISAEELKTIVKETSLKQAVISAEPYIVHDRVVTWCDTLLEGGIQEIKFGLPQPKVTDEEKIRRVLSRQKGDELKIYLEGSRAIFVNGTQVNQEILAEIIKQSELEQAEISSSIQVLPERITEFEEWLEEQGMERVTKTGFAALDLSDQEIARATKEEEARERELKLREILSRQTDDTLSLYLNDKGTYINGKSISLDELGMIVTASGMDAAIVSTETHVAYERVIEWVDALQQSGIDKIELTNPKDD